MSLHIGALRKKRKVKAMEPICTFVATLTLREFHALLYGNKDFRERIVSHTLDGTYCEYCAPTVLKSRKLFSHPPSASAVKRDFETATKKYTHFCRQLDQSQ